MEITGSDIKEQLAVMGMASYDNQDKYQNIQDIEEISENVNNIKEAERISICNALKETKGNREKASKLLGISKSTLWRKMKEYNISEKF